MRIPLAKIYRAFPELDPFPDHECERFVKRARRAVLKWMWLPILALPAAFLVAVGLIGLVTWAMGGSLTPAISFIDRRIGGLWGAQGVSPGELTVLGWMLIMPTVGPWLAFAVSRDALLRRAIGKRLAVVSCTKCEHSLLGLPLLEKRPKPAVRCPECGTLLVLAEIGLTPVDLIVGARGEVEEKTDAESINADSIDAAD